MSYLPMLAQWSNPYMKAQTLLRMGLLPRAGQQHSKQIESIDSHGIVQPRPLSKPLGLLSTGLVLGTASRPNETSWPDPPGITSSSLLPSRRVSHAAVPSNRFPSTACVQLTFSSVMIVT